MLTRGCFWVFTKDFLGLGFESILNIWVFMRVIGVYSQVFHKGYVILEPEFQG